MGPQLIEKAKQIASSLGKQKFMGSNGWLEKWKRKYNIKELRISGESGDVEGPTVDSWLERLPELVLVMLKTTFGTWMKRASSGKRYLTEGLG